ncbi:MAG: hypothetical protein ACRDT0_07835 [Pseudonocardiaceae bacterium]
MPVEAETLAEAGVLAAGRPGTAGVCCMQVETPTVPAAPNGGAAVVVLPQPRSGAGAAGSCTLASVIGGMSHTCA